MPPHIQKDQKKEFGGEIGPLPLSNAHPLLSKLLQISKSGQLWPPKKVDDWWIIVRLERVSLVQN